MNFNTLRYVVAVAQERNFTKAARKVVAFQHVVEFPLGNAVLNGKHAVGELVHNSAGNIWDNEGASVGSDAYAHMNAGVRDDAGYFSVDLGLGQENLLSELSVYSL